ncbi:MAG: VOC family protein [Streptosporangiales bacterium]|nr:VOC family protein [Streptosporangiales bacterium]
MRIAFAQIFVTDQDAAKAFYTEKLGFVERTDAAYGPGARWLTVASPDDQEGPELLLGLPDEDARAFQKHVHDAGQPAMSFTTDDIQGDYERLRAAGVAFTLPPTTMEYGGTDAIFEDTCGNLVNLHQG